MRQAIIFDLGRVLVNVDITRGIFALMAQAAASTEKAVTVMMQHALYAEFNAGKFTPQEFHERMCEQLGLAMSFEQFADAWCDVFTSMDGMDEVIRELAAKHTLGLLSDTDPLHWNFIRNEYPFVELIARPTLSFETGYRKPAREAYLAAAKNVGAAPVQCVFVDDLMVNVDGARQVGMDAIQFTGVAALRRELAERLSN